jgi:RimJ/RimL family protein N-acetyltransferase
MRHQNPPETTALIHATIDADSATVELAIEWEGRGIGKAGFWHMPEVGYILYPDHGQRGFGA